MDSAKRNKLLAGALILLGLCLGALPSCRSVPGPFSGTTSWSAAAGHKRRATLRFLDVSVEKAGGQAALEREIAALVPLILWEKGYYFSSGDFSPGDRRADYVVDVQAREREYLLGWRTRRSLALEVRLWPDRGEDPRLYETTPLAAAQIISKGTKTFSSSRQLNRMLRTAARRALRALGHKPGPRTPGPGAPGAPEEGRP